MSCSNRVLSDALTMYDAFSFRNEMFPYTIQEWDEFCKDNNVNQVCAIAHDKAGSKKYNSFYFGPITEQIQQKIFPTSPLMTVDSCFGGVVIYKKSFIGSCRYVSIKGDCERVKFNECLKKNNARIVPNPPKMVRMAAG